SGRMYQEQYAITPTHGFVDPLAEYYGSGASMGGGISSEQPLDGKPFLLHVSLNDWVRFTEAGTYQLVVTSHRLERHFGQAAPTVISAPIEFTMSLSDAASDAARLTSALSLIDRGDQQSVQHGARMLRYLATRGAAQALLDRYDAIEKVDAWDLHAALISS